MRFSSYIAKRYLISKSSNNAINIITLIAAIGVVVGAMSLFIVLSGFSGLKDFSLSFSNIFDADLKVLPKTGKHFKFNPQDEARLKEIEGIASYSKIIEERVFLSFDGKRHIAYIKGVDENYRQVTQIDSTLLVGNWFEATQPHTVIGLNISSILSLGLYDYNEALEIYVPKPGNGDILDASKAFNKKSVLVSGIYQINEDLDGKYVFSNFNLAKSLLVMPENSVTGIEIKLSPQADEASIIKNVETLFQQKVIVKNRIQQNDTLYKMLNTENLAVYLIVSLIAAIALFNIAGAIIMMILDKRKSIITYYNLGATLREIRRIFFTQGALMTIFGTVSGIILGMLIVFLQINFSLVMITPSLPYPIKFEMMNVIIVFFTVATLGIIASKIAASRVNEKLLR